MINRKLITTLLAVLTAVVIMPLTSVRGQNIFSGTIKFKTQDENGKVSNMTYYGKDGKTRIDMSGPMGKMSMISDGKTMDIIMPAQKMYMEYSGVMSKMAGLGTSNDDTSDAVHKTDWKKVMEKARTGKTRNILGHVCDEFVMPNDNGGSMQIWATKDVGSLVLMKSPFGQNPFASEMKEMGAYFPMLTEEFNAEGKVVMKFEVTEMTNEKPDDSKFNIPSGYKKMSMPGMK